MAAHQAPPSLGFSRQEHWSGLPFPSPMHESEVAQSCLTLSMDCSLPGSSVHGIFQARVLEWGAIVFSILLPRGFQKERQKLTWEKKSNNLSPRKCQKRKANYIYCHISKPSLIQDEIIFYTTPHKQEMGGSV